MDDRRDERAQQAGQYAGFAMLAVYMPHAWAGIELLSPALCQELARRPKAYVPAAGVF